MIKGTLVLTFAHSICVMKRSCSLPFLGEPENASYSSGINETEIRTPLHMGQAELPPPKPFVKRSTNTPELTLTIGASKPYRILHASQQFCSLIQTTNDQIDGRSLSCLYGPDTNKSTLLSTIKWISADHEHKSASIPIIKIYGQDQKVCLLKAQLQSSPVDSNDSSTRQVVIHFKPIHHPLSKSAFGHSEGRMKAQRELRAHYNFITGLAVHMENCQAKGETAPGKDLRDASLCLDWDD